MRGFVANTDYGWYQFLRARPELREVNFWRPSQNRFAALQPGELLFFKLKAPHNAIGGFGMFTRQAVKPVWEAWDIFGAANGTPDIESLLARLAPLTGTGGLPPSIDTWIGCLAINEPIFFPPDEWVSTPDDWQPQIVSGKGYDLAEGEGRALYERCLAKAELLAKARDFVGDAGLAARYGPAQLVAPRLGQASFRLAVMDAYSARCAITGERSLPVVEAAHIRPYSAGGEHAVRNGLPMRRDVHRLFDLGYVSVRPDYSFAVSDSLEAQYANGKIYYDLEGTKARDPVRVEDRASPDVLDWHFSEVFRS